MSAPREIWLQTEDNPASTDAFKVVSWCESALNSTAVPYILKSDFDALQTKLDKIYETPAIYQEWQQATQSWVDSDYEDGAGIPTRLLIIKPTKEPT